MDLKTLIATMQGTVISGSGKKANKNLMGLKKNAKTIMTAKNINKINSIKGQARKSIAQYPVLVSENLNPKLVPILTNAIELENASLLMLVLGNVSTFSSGDASSVIRKFHREDTDVFLPGVSNVNELYDANASLMCPYNESFNLQSVNESYYTKDFWDYLTEANNGNNNQNNNNQNPGWTPSPSQVQRKYVADLQNSENRSELTQKQNNDYDADRKLSRQHTQAQINKINNDIKAQNQKMNDYQHDRKLKNTEIEQNIKKNQKELDNYDKDHKLKNQKTKAEIRNTNASANKTIQDINQSKEKHALDMKRGRIGLTRDKIAVGKDIVGIGKDITGIAKDIQGMKHASAREKDRKKEVLDQRNRDKYRSGKGVVTTTMKDLTKANDMQPLVLNVDVSFLEPSGQTVVDRTLSIGVKAVSHLVRSDDISYYLSKAAYKNSKFLKLIKWTSGEIKFWKDLVFALDDIKMSVIQNSKTIANRNYFSKLEYISKVASQSVIAGVKTEDLPTAITTLIITKTDVENIKYRDGIDILSNPNYLKRIFKQYYLLNLLVVDESLEIVYKYDESRNTIERVPFTSYEKMSKERTVNANDLLKLANR